MDYLKKEVAESFLKCILILFFDSGLTVQGSPFYCLPSTGRRGKTVQCTSALGPKTISKEHLLYGKKEHSP